MSSESLLRFSSKFDSALLVADNMPTTTEMTIKKMSAAGIFISCVSAFEVYFEESIQEYCASLLHENFTNRHKAVIFNYLYCKSKFTNHAINQDEKSFIKDIEKEIEKTKPWLDIASVEEIDPTLLIGKKDYPKPNHIELAFFKIGMENNAGSHLSRDLGENFTTTLDRILELRSTIAHYGIPDEWNISDLRPNLHKLKLIAENIDFHLFGTVVNRVRPTEVELV